MKYILSLFAFFIVFTSLSIEVGSEPSEKFDGNSVENFYNFSELGGVYYQDEISTFIIDFDLEYVDSVMINDIVYASIGNDLFEITDLELGEYTIVAFFENGQKHK